MENEKVSLYSKNKEYIKMSLKRDVVCECGMKMRLSNLWRHRKGRLHIKKLNENKTDWEAEYRKLKDKYDCIYELNKSLIRNFDNELN
jgi:hypothetical protein